MDTITNDTVTKIEWFKKNALLSAVCIGLGSSVFMVVVVTFVYWNFKLPGFPLDFTDSNHYRHLFVIGMIGSVWAQNTVASFFDFTDIYDSVTIPWRPVIEKASVFVLTALGLAALFTTGQFWMHVIITISYTGVVLFLDWYVWRHSSNSSNSDGASLLSKMCAVMMWKIDGISFIGLAALSGFAAFLGVVANTVAGDHTDKEVVFLFTEVFLSGAIGFHFIVTTWLIFGFLFEWHRDLKGRPPATARVEVAPAQHG